MTPTRYAEYHSWPGPLGRLHRHWLRWRHRAERETADGRDYTGWRVRIASLPDPRVRPGVGAEGEVVSGEGEGRQRRHQLDFGRNVWNMALPSRHVELIPPTEEG